MFTSTSLSGSSIDEIERVVWPKAGFASVMERCQSTRSGFCHSIARIPLVSGNLN